MSTDIFRRYLDLLNEADLPGQTPAQFVPTHFHKGSLLGNKVPLMQTPDGKFWWMTTDPDNPRAGKTIQPWTGNTDDRSWNSPGSVDGIFKDGKAIEFPEGSTWRDYAANQNAETAVVPDAASDVVGANSVVGNNRSTPALAPGEAGSAVPDSGRPALAPPDSGKPALAPGEAVPDNTTGGTHCAQCGTPKSMHQDLKHSFVAGDDVRPDPVSQTRDTGGNEKADRIRAMQTELKKAGADLGTFGPGGDGIDGVIGKVTLAAMAKYPDIAKKYPDLVSGGGQNKQSKVSLDQLNRALSTIEGVLNKYKIKINEHKKSLAGEMISEAPTAAEIEDYLKNLLPDPGSSTVSTSSTPSSSGSNRVIPRQAGSNLTPAQQAAQRAGIGIPRLATTAGADAAEKGVLKGAGKLAGKTVGRLAPGVGTTLSAMDAYDRWKSGDKSGAVIAALAGAGWLVPGPLGWAIGGGLEAANLARDLSNRVAISDQDAKIIRDNLPVIIEWQSDPENAKNADPAVTEHISRVMKALKSVGIEAAGPAAPAAPAAPAGGGTQNAQTTKTNITALNQTLDRMDQLLKKNNFESMVRKNLVKDMHLLSESEQMALRRNLLKEDWSWSDLLPDLTIGNALAGTWLYNKGRKHGLEIARAGSSAAQGAAAQGAAAQGAAAQGAAPAAGAAAQGAAGANSTYLNRLKAGLLKVASGAKTAGKWGLILSAAAAVGVVGKLTYDWAMANPEKAKAAGIDPDDLKQYKQLSDQLAELLPQTDEEFNALPPDVQQRINTISARMVKMNEQIVKAVQSQAQ